MQGWQQQKLASRLDDVMTDKELLKLAAKAAGYEVSESNQGINLDFEIFKENENYVYCHHNKPWNPITDDGDALRLAVKLLFEIEMTQDCIAVRHSTGVKIFEAFNNDKYTATRRAIVRAAAEIGKRIKNELFELFKRRL